MIVAAIVATHAFHSVPIDFEVYLRGGRYVTSGDDQLYINTNQLPFTYPPIAALIFTAALLLPGVLGSILLTAGSVACFVGISALWWQHTIAKVAPNQPWWWFPAAVTIAGFLEPVTSTYRFGQINLLLVMAITYAIFSAKPAVRGFIIGAVTAIKLTPGVFLLWLLVTKQFKAAAVAFSTIVGMIGIGFVFLPESSKAYWGGTGFNANRVGGPAYVSNQSINGMVWRMNEPGGNTLIWFVVCSAIMLVCLAVAWQLYRRSMVPESGLVMGFSALICSPISWIHHWVWIWPAMLLAAAAWAMSRRESKNRTGALALASAWLVVGMARFSWQVPHGDDQEYNHTFIQAALADTLIVLGLVTVAWLTYWAFKHRTELQP